MSKRQKRQKEKSFIDSAEYFKALFRARFVKAMKKLQKEVSINQLALSMHSTRTSAGVITNKQIVDALTPLKQVIKDAYRKGGKLGADHVKALLKNG
jgi:hypothetical protein